MSGCQLSEREVCTKLITPAIECADWGIQAQVREEVLLTAGWVVVRGRLVPRSTAKRGDHVLDLRPQSVARGPRIKEHTRGGSVQSRWRRPSQQQ
jgi:type I restriction enzyme R subunit